MTRAHLHRTVIGHALLGLMLAANAPAQDAGLTPEAAAQVDAVFKLWDRETTAGCAVSVTKAGETVYARGFGMAHLEQSAPSSPGRHASSGTAAGV